MTNPQPPGGNAPASGTRPGAVLALMGILVGVIVGGGLLVWWLTQGGPREPSGGPRPQVVIETSEGTIKVELFEKDAPITVKNFLDYVDDNHYDGTIFHRVVSTGGIAVIQGGGFTPDMRPKGEPGRKGIKNEASNGLSNERGTIAMARTPAPDSATDQFYINVKDNLGLDRAKAPDRVGYAVFGKVIAGMDVVDKIAKVKTGPNDVPAETVLIKSIHRVEKK
jgi:cyclophilin family peptidyl-prolyl cis-trans isomerase